jgi:hypothetical protein
MSLVIHGVRLIKKNLQKSTLAFKAGGGEGGYKLIVQSNFGGKLIFILSFLFLERLHCCYMYNYYNYYPTFCMKS